MCRARLLVGVNGVDAGAVLQLEGQGQQEAAGGKGAEGRAAWMAWTAAQECPVCSSSLAVGVDDEWTRLSCGDGAQSRAVGSRTR
jgi:hypothetical protein